MLLGARQFFERRGGGGWQNPYVTDGLIAMWDGEWNAGGGVHDANATVWKDLSATGNDATLSQWATWSGDSLVTDGTHYAALADADKLSGVRFAEIAYRRTLTRYGYVGLFAVKKIGPSDNASSLMMAFRSSAFMAGDHGRLVIDGEYRNAAINNVPLSGTIGVDYYVPKIYIDSSEGEIVADGEAWSQTTVGEIGGRYARAGNVYNGEICSIRIYNRALTAAEIAANYAIDKQRFNLP